MGKAESLVSPRAGAYSRCVPRFCPQCALFQAWLNEKFAPELLESKPEIIECVVEQLDHMVGSAGLGWWCRQAVVTWPGRYTPGDGRVVCCSVPGIRLFCLPSSGLSWRGDWEKQRNTVLCVTKSSCSLVLWTLCKRHVFLSGSCYLTFQLFNFCLHFLVGGKPEAGEEGRLEGQRSPHGD